MGEFEVIFNRENLSRAQLLVIDLLVLQAVLSLLIVEVEAAGNLDNVLHPDSKHPCRRSEMDPTHELRFGQDVVWQIPPNPKAVLFMAHGGSMDAVGYFDPGPKCEQCTGKPESRAVVLEALRRNYAVIALKSVTEAFDSWPLEDSKDIPIAINVVNDWTREHSLDHLPLAAWGHSAGCLFVSSLTKVLPIRALILMCCPGQREVLENATPENFPPILFAFMPADKGTPISSSTRVGYVMAMLRERGFDVAGKPCLPRPFSALFLTERIRCMSDRMAEKVHAAYKAEGWLGTDDYLVKDPMLEDWLAVLWKWNALPFCTQLGHLCLASHVGQELTAAFAVHSLTSDANEEIYTWLDSKLLTTVDIDMPVTSLSASQLDHKTSVSLA